MAKQENIDIITLGQVTPIIDNLDSTRTDAALSANMGKKLNDEKYLITYTNIGNTSTTTDILAFAITAEPGFYRSIDKTNLFSNLPISISSNSFTLEIQSTGVTSKIILLRSSNSNDVFINTYIDNEWKGWDLIDQSIKYKNIGNITTETDILALAKTLSPGFYRSAKTANKWINLPEKSSNSFELIISSISMTVPYRTLQLKDYKSNNIWINTLNYDGNVDNWAGWTLLINDSNPNNMIYKKVIESKEQFDEINFNVNGIYYIKNFNTIFPNNGIKPAPFNYGYLEVMTHTSNEAFLTYTPYRLIDGNKKLVNRVNNGVLDTWMYENNFPTTNKGNINMYGTGAFDDESIKFYDYETGTLKYAIKDVHNHETNPHLEITNITAGTSLSLTDDKTLTWWDSKYNTPIKLNPFFDYGNIVNMGAWLNQTDNIDNSIIRATDGGITTYFMRSKVDTIHTPQGTLPPLTNGTLITSYAFNKLYGYQTAFDIEGDISNMAVRNIKNGIPSTWTTLFSTENSKVVTIGNYGEAGYVIFANGLILQWGLVVVTPNAITYQQYVNLNIPYTTAFNVFVERSYSNHSPANLQFVAWRSELNAFRIYTETTKLNLPDTYYWFSIGI